METSQLLVNKFKAAVLSILLIIPFLSWNCSAGSAGIVNIGIAKDEVINYHKSGQYNNDLREAIKDAEEKFNEVDAGPNSAVVFDIDETVITSYEYYRKWDFGYVPKYFDMWVDSAKAPAILPVLDLYNYLLKRNFRIIFITGRKEYQYESTFNNLINAGYSKFDTLIVKGEEYSGKTAEKFKSDKRAELVEKGYTIAGTVGDQWSDLSGPYHGIQVKIPNYMYIIY
jgi:acid phosphatase